MMEKTLILKHISRMLCLLISYSKFTRTYYKLTVEDYLKNGYNEDTAQIEALKELQKKFSIYFKEVTEDDCV